MPRLITIGLLAAVMATPALAREPVVLAPSSPWNVHYAENSCRLGRSFGTGKDQTTMVLERLSPDSAMTLSVFGGALRVRGVGATARAAFLPLTDQTFEVTTVAETVDTKQPALFWSSVTFQAPATREERRAARRADARLPRNLEEIAAEREEQDARAGQVTGLEIVEPGGRRLMLRTGPMKAALATMRECAREQLTAWGIDPVVHDRLALRARGDLSRLFQSSDYPQLAVLRGEEAVISARLIVGADGRVTRCTSLTQFKAPEMAEVVCRRLSRAVFEPAELADGTKVPDLVVTRIRFELP